MKKKFKILFISHKLRYIIFNLFLPFFFYLFVEEFENENVSLIKFLNFFKWCFHFIDGDQYFFLIKVYIWQQLIVLRLVTLN